MNNDERIINELTKSIKDLNNSVLNSSRIVNSNSSKQQSASVGLVGSLSNMEKALGAAYVGMKGLEGVLSLNTKAINAGASTNGILRSMDKNLGSLASKLEVGYSLASVGLLGVSDSLDKLATQERFIGKNIAESLGDFKLLRLNLGLSNSNIEKMAGEFLGFGRNLGADLNQMLTSLNGMKDSLAPFSIAGQGILGGTALLSNALGRGLGDSLPSILGPILGSNFSDLPRQAMLGITDEILAVERATGSLQQAEALKALIQETDKGLSRFMGNNRYANTAMLQTLGLPANYPLVLKSALEQLEKVNLASIPSQSLDERFKQTSIAFMDGLREPLMQATVFIRDIADSVGISAGTLGNIAGALGLVGVAGAGLRGARGLLGGGSKAAASLGNLAGMGNSVGGMMSTALKGVGAVAVAGIATKVANDVLDSNAGNKAYDKIAKLTGWGITSNQLSEAERLSRLGGLNTAEQLKMESMYFNADMQNKQLTLMDIFARTNEEILKTNKEQQLQLEKIKEELKKKPMRKSPFTNEGR